MTKELALGIDIGGTNTAFGVCDRKGNLLFEGNISTTDYDRAEALVTGVYDALKSTHFLPQIVGIGIGAPNGNFFTGTIEFAPNLNWKGSVPLVELFQNEFGVPAVLTNDANAAAIGEMIFGSARDLNDFVIITLGTGLGSGIVSKRKLVYGHDGFAGEYGHIRVVPNGRMCGCGRNGCLETYASSTGVVRSVHEMESASKMDSSLLSIENIEATHIFQEAQKGDVFAREIVDYTAEILGNALADFACFNSPEAYVLFGGIAQSGTFFADKVKQHLGKNVLNIYKDKIDVRVSELHGKNAAVLGAVSLVWNEIAETV